MDSSDSLIEVQETINEKATILDEKSLIAAAWKDESGNALNILVRLLKPNQNIKF